MATLNQAPEAFLQAQAQAQPIQGFTDQQRHDIAVLVATTSLTHEQACAQVAPKAPATVVAAHKTAIAAVAATKTAAHPVYVELVAGR